MKSKTWRRVSLDTEIDGRANEVTIAVGDEGKTISRLAPAGKALIKGQVVEVHTVSDYLDTDVPVKVIEVDGYRIIVERNKYAFGFDVIPSTEYLSDVTSQISSTQFLLQ